MLPLHCLEMWAEIRLHDGGQHRHAILVALASAHDDLVPAEIDVLDAQAAALEQSQPGAIHQIRHESRGPVQAPEDGADFLARQHDGETFGSARPHDPVEPWHVELEDLAIQEEQRAERLILGGRGNPAVHRERRQKAGDLGGAHFSGMTTAVKDDVASDPRHVRRFGVATVVARPDRRAHPIEQPRFRGPTRVWPGCVAHDEAA